MSEEGREHVKRGGSMQKEEGACEEWGACEEGREDVKREGVHEEKRERVKRGVSE